MSLVPTHDARAAGGVRPDTEEYRWQLRGARLALAANGRYDVGRLADAQVLAMARRDGWSAELAARWARRPRTRFARGGGAGRSGPSTSPPAEATPASSTDEAPAPPALAWIEIEVVDEDGVAYAGESYRLGSTDGRTNGGRLDDRGWFRLDGIPAGTCRLDFPELVSAALEEG